MVLSAALTLIGSACALAAAVLLVVHYGSGEGPLVGLVESCSAKLKEIECKSREGAHGEGEADAARSGALHALVHDLRARESRWWMLRGDRSALVIVALAATSMAALSSLGVIDTVGDRPSLSASTSGTSVDSDVARLAAYAQSLPFSPSPRRKDDDSGAGRSLPDVGTMIDRLTIRLKDQPDDVEGWRMLGWSHFHTQQPRKAAEAYERALALQPASADLMVAYGEALVGAEGGTLTAKATAMFSAALKVEAANPKARYFMGLAKQQAGREREALDEWLSIEVEPASDEPWITELRERIGTLANKLGVDVSLRMKQAKLSPGSTARANRLEPRPSEAFQKIEALPPDQQSAIRGMVEGLAKRLEASPRDEEGWIKLMRSRVVLGEGTIARETLERALAVFVNDAAAQARLQSSAEELGISSN